jgi:hypothetical protein
LQEQREVQERVRQYLPVWCASQPKPLDSSAFIAPDWSFLTSGLARWFLVAIDENVVEVTKDGNFMRGDSYSEGIFEHAGRKDTVPRPILRHQLELAELLRRRLEESDWQVVNETPLPLVCFVDRAGADPDAIVEAVNASRAARIFTATLPPGRRVIRAAITNFRTGREDIDALVEALARARRVHPYVD